MAFFLSGTEPALKRESDAPEKKEEAVYPPHMK
jgi:hypothetical protein